MVAFPWMTHSEGSQLPHHEDSQPIKKPHWPQLTASLNFPAIFPSHRSQSPWIWMPWSSSTQASSWLKPQLPFDWKFMRPQVRTTQLNHSPNSDPYDLWETINDSCDFKPSHFGVFCYTKIGATANTICPKWDLLGCLYPMITVFYHFWQVLSHCFFKYCFPSLSIFILDSSLKF